MNRSRRHFLKMAAASTATLALSQVFGTRLVHAASLQGSGKAVVFVNLMGGIDGLSWFIPTYSSAYYQRRPNIAIQARNALAISGEIALHSAWKKIFDTVHQEARLAVVECVGYPNPTLSHEESELVWSLGKRDLGGADRRGWIGRVADQYFDTNTDVVGIGLGNRADFKANRDWSAPLVIDNIRDFGLSWDWRSGYDGYFRNDVAQANAYSPSKPSGVALGVKDSTKKIYQLAEQLYDIDEEYRSNIQYPGNTLGYRLREVAKLLKGNIGTQIFYTGIEGFDTHGNQADRLRDGLSNVADAVDAFVKDLKAMGKWNQVCLVFFSEFGRSCAENGSLGTEHGHGNSVSLIGGSVRGGIHGPIPSNDDLNQEFVPSHVDFRAILKGVMRDHLGLDPGPIFSEGIPANDLGLSLFA